MSTTTIDPVTTPKYWVSMTDKFMSGWGMATNKTNKLVIACDTYEQAETIERNARKRREMKYVNLCIRKPRYGNHVLVSEKHFSDMGGPWLDK